MTPDPALPQGAAQPQLLLVEDEEALRTLLARFLERAGYSVLAAGSGEEALAAFAAGPERFAAAVVDLTLPDMSGEALLTQLRESRPDLPVLVTSGMARSAMEFATASGARVHFLQKPFLPARLVESLAALLQAPASSRAQSSSPSSAS